MVVRCPQCGTAASQVFIAPEPAIVSDDELRAASGQV
jgi:uncharacterized protein (UPF0212 family)